MKILDLVDTSRAATQHMRNTGDQVVLPLSGVIPLTRATIWEDISVIGGIGTNVVNFPEAGGLRMKRKGLKRAGSGSFYSGLCYLLDNIDPGLAQRNTQLNLSLKQTYNELPSVSMIASAWQDCYYILRSPAGVLSFYAMEPMRTLSAELGRPAKREVIVDRVRKVITLYNRHPVTGVPSKFTYGYAAQTTMTFAGIGFGLGGTLTGSTSTGFSQTYNYDVTFEDILFTENDLPTDPSRHGPYDLATFFDVIPSGNANAATLNARRTVPAVQADRFTGKPSVPIAKDAPVALSLRSTLLTDQVVQGKGKCLAVVVGGDIKNTQGKMVCKAAVQDGRLAVFRTPRTHPFQQSVGMPGIDATFAQIDIRKPDGTLDATVLGKTITLSV